MQKRNRMFPAFTIGLLLLTLVPFPVQAATSELEVLETYVGTANQDEAFQSAFTDTDGNIYFATDYTNPIRIYKYDTDLNLLDSLSLSTGEEYPYTAASHEGYAYIGLWDNTGRIVRVNLSTFDRVDVIDPSESNAGYTASVIDTENDIGYFLTSGTPSKIVKVDLNDFTATPTILTLNAGQGSVYANPVIDNGFMYVATYSSPTIVVKVDLSSFTVSSATTLSSGENSAYGMAYNEADGLVYIQTATNPNKIVEFDINTMTRVSATTYATHSWGSNNAIAYDPDFNKIYMLEGSTPGTFAQINADTFVMEDSVEVKWTEGMVWDMENKLAYVGTYNDPAEIYKIQLYNEVADPTPAPAPGAVILPAGAYVPPSAPAGGFQVSLGGQAGTTFNTSSREIKLSFNAGSDVTGIAISENADFTGAIIEKYAPELNYTLCSSAGGFLKDLTCAFGTKPLYIKFYNQYGRSTEPMTITINYGAPGTNSPTPSVPPVSLEQKVGRFLRNLQVGSRGEDVRNLQVFLNTNGFTVSDSGAGARGSETILFGTKTKQALIRFQNYYKDKILTPLGLQNGTGYFGPSTRNFVNSLIQ
jgi:hypothetical protein